MIMKQVLFFVLLLAMLVSGCSQEEMLRNGTFASEESRIFITSFEKNESRTYVENGCLSRWTKGDFISLFVGNTLNCQYLFDGETGDSGGKFFMFGKPEGKGTSLNTNYAVYPYDKDMTISNDGVLAVTLPSEQSYAENSYGLGDNTMVAVTENADDTFLNFKNVGGSIKLQLYGDDITVKSIILMGNNGEKIAGKATLTAAYDKTPVVSMAEDATTFITLDCGKEGVKIGTSEEEATAFWITVPPTTFEKGITITVKDVDKSFVKTTDKQLVIKRNVVTPMVPVRPALSLSSSPQIVAFYLNGVKGEINDNFIHVQMPYGTDVSALETKFVVNEGIVTVDGNEITPLSKMNFSSPVEFKVTSVDGMEKSFIVSISYSNLPVVYINTKNAAPIVSKTTWLKDSKIYITNAGEYNDLYESSSIRGRGNTTWGYPKKPYAIKLDSKEEVLGMPKHKRWVLLANYVDKTCIRNSVAFEIARRCEGLDWTSRGKHVDVVLNGIFMGNYYLCEQIKVDKNRVNIAEMESEDIDSESITGGYLLEVDKNYDEVNKFRSPVRNMPFMIKEPDEEVLVTEQYTYIYNHVAEVENALYGANSTTEGYLKYIDLDSFVDYWIVYELTGTGEPTHPKSVYMHKDRNGKIHAGPVWDFDYFTFQPYYKNMLINTNAVWNDRIINDPATHAVIKQRWNASKEYYRSIADEMDRQYNEIKESAEYNSLLWPLSLNVNRDDALSVKDAVARMKEYYVNKFNYMDSYINTYF